MSIANGADPIQQKAAADANAVQDACNLTTIVGCFHRHLLALHRSGIRGDNLINHPVTFFSTSRQISMLVSDIVGVAALSVSPAEANHGRTAVLLEPLPPHGDDHVLLLVLLGLASILSRGFFGVFAAQRGASRR